MYEASVFYYLYLYMTVWRETRPIVWRWVVRENNFKYTLRVVILNIAN